MKTLVRRFWKDVTLHTPEYKEDRSARFAVQLMFSAVTLITLTCLLSACGANSGSTLTDEQAIALLQRQDLQFAIPAIDASFLGDTSLEFKGIQADEDARKEAEGYISVLEDEGADEDLGTFRPFGCKIEFEGESLRTAHTTAVVFEYDDQAKSWSVFELIPQRYEAYPTAAVSDEEIENAVHTFITAIDANDDAHDESLSNLYNQNLQQSVIKNDFLEQGGAASDEFTLHIAAKQGMARYEGDISGTLVWDCDGTWGWRLERASVNSEAYQADYSDLIGTWTGIRIGPDPSYSQGNCLGAASHPATMTIKSVDSTSHVMTVDLEFLAHNHMRNDNIQQGTDGDAMESLTNATFPIDTSAQTTAYTYRYDSYDRIKYELNISFTEDDTISMSVYFKHYEDPSASVTYSSDFQDKYTFTKKV